MNGVCLLSEISPLGTSHFNPLRQTADWYGLVQPEEIRDLPDQQAFGDAIHQISRRAREHGLTLVVRDWSHLDWIGFPFVDPPMQFSWQTIDDDQDSSRLPENGASWLGPRCATVRHPVDQYLSTKTLGILKESWNDAAVWRGMRAFAEAIQSMPWFRYEDFLADPAGALQSLCDAMAIPYDPCWEQRWASYDKITGDTLALRRTMIRPIERKPVEPVFWRQVGDNEDFYATLELLGYSVPEPLRFARSVQRPIRMDDATVGAEQVGNQHRGVAKDWDEIAVRQRQACAGAAANFLLYINYSDHYTAAEIANEHLRLGMRFTERPEKLAKRKRVSGEKLRVGYLGSDYELVAGDAEEYEEIAVQLLYNLKSLRNMRAIIRERFYEGALTDPVGLTRELEEKMMSWSNS
jgi:protein O-GlcNAc transferase